MKRSALTLDEAMAIGRRDAHEQAASLRSGELSAAELVDAAIVRIEHLDAKVGAVSHRAFDSARERAVRVRAAGTLAGVPYLIKDSLEYPGMPARAGSRSRGDALSTSMYPFIERFDREGLIPVGMSAMPEFGLMGTTEPLRYGPTRNPWALDRSPGGSSGGAAAAVAAGMVPLAHASDAAGSIRIPASCCGVFGYKTSRGANVRARAQHVLDDVLCSDGMISRSVRDAAWAFDVARPDRATTATNDPLRRLRIAVVLEGLDGAAPDAEVTNVIGQTADLCEQLGHRVASARLPLDGRELVHDLLVLWGYLGSEVVDRVRSESLGRPLEDLLEPFTLNLGNWGSRLQGTDLERAFAQVTELPKALMQFFQNFDVVLSPVTREPPLPLGRLAPTQPFEPLMRDMFGYVNYTPLHNMAGTPAMSVPLFSSAQGLPIGSMFAAARGADELLFALAAELERARPWKDRWPTV